MFDEEKKDFCEDLIKNVILRNTKYNICMGNQIRKERTNYTFEEKYISGNSNN